MGHEFVSLLFISFNFFEKQWGMDWGGELPLAACIEIVLIVCLVLRYDFSCNIFIKSLQLRSANKSCSFTWGSSFLRYFWWVSYWNYWFRCWLWGFWLLIYLILCQSIRWIFFLKLRLWSVKMGACSTAPQKPLLIEIPLDHHLFSFISRKESFLTPISSSKRRTIR